MRHATCDSDCSSKMQRKDAQRRLTSRHIQEVKLMLPKIPDKANVTGNECAAAAIEVEASRGMAKFIVVWLENMEQEEGRRGRKTDEMRSDLRYGTKTK